MEFNFLSLSNNPRVGRMIALWLTENLSMIKMKPENLLFDHYAITVISILIGRSIQFNFLQTISKQINRIYGTEQERSIPKAHNDFTHNSL